MLGFEHFTKNNRFKNMIPMRTKFETVNMNNSIIELPMDSIFQSCEVSGKPFSSEKENLSANKNSEFPMNFFTKASRLYYFTQVPIISAFTSAAFVGFDINDIVRLKSYINELNIITRESSKSGVFSDIDKNAKNYAKTCDAIEKGCMQVDIETAFDMGVPKKIRDKEIGEKLAPLLKLIDVERKFSEKDLNIDQIIEWKKEVEKRLESISRIDISSDKLIAQEVLDKQSQLDKVNLFLCSIKIKNSNVKLLKEAMRYLGVDTTFLASDVTSMIGMSGMPMVSKSLFRIARLAHLYTSIISHDKISDNAIKKFGKFFGINKKNDDLCERSYVEMLMGFYERQILDYKLLDSKGEQERQLNKQQFDRIITALDMDLNLFYKNPKTKESTTLDEMRTMLKNAFEK